MQRILFDTDVILDSIGFNQVSAVVGGQTEIVVGYITNEPVQLRAQGYDINVIAVADHIQLAANGLITNETAISENPEMVARFVSAFLKGLQDTIDNPEEAYQISTKYVENLAELDQEVQMEVLNLSIEYWEAETLGYSEQAAWENMQRVLLEMGLLAEPLDLSAAFTNEFIK